MGKKVTVAIAGLGSRGRLAYAKCSQQFQDQMQIVAIADIVREKVDETAKEYGIAPEMCFNSAEEMLEQERLADVMFICTMDRQHFGHAIPALKKGYHLLLEKPVSPDIAQCKEIAETALACGRHVVVCHVLRYTPFYGKIKALLDEGVIGDVVNIQAIENVGYWHQAHSFVRGNWCNSEETSPMILQKSCHDLDLFLWLTGKSCKRVSSYGGLTLFKPEMAPEGSTTRCMDGCKVQESCPFDAEKIYMTGLHGVKNGYTQWPVDVLSITPTVDSIYAALRNGPYGQCVYHCGNNVVDHQVVNMALDGGTTVGFTMCGLTTELSRKITIMGTRGELLGDMGTNCIDVCLFGQPTKHIDLRETGEDFFGHGGGDSRILKDLLDLVSNDKPAGSSLTSIDKSVESHYVALAAEYSRLHQGESVDIMQFAKQA